MSSRCIGQAYWKGISVKKAGVKSRLWSEIPVPLDVVNSNGGFVVIPAHL